MLKCNTTLEISSLPYSMEVNCFRVACVLKEISRDIMLYISWQCLLQLLLGLRDSSDQIASLSLHALAELVLVLGRDVVIGGESKRFYSEGKPKVGVTYKTTL